MARYICTGRVHPERADISFSRFELQLREFGGGIAIASCDASQVTVMLDVDSIDDVVLVKLIAEDMANIVIGAFGFSSGSGYSVELIQVVEPDGTPRVFGVRPEGSQGQTLQIDPQHPVLNRALMLAIKDKFYRLAIRDYVTALTEWIDCPTHCYRAIEAIKSAFVFRTGNDRWDDMHSALGTDRDTITRTVKDFADPVRHGNWTHAKSMDTEQRWQMLSLTRDILLKYLDHAESATSAITTHSS